MSALPKLPAGWEWRTVGELAADEPNAITDGPFGSNLKTAHYTESGPRVIRLQNIGDGTFIDAAAHISDEHFQRLFRHRVFAGDIVIAALGESPPRSCIIPEAVGPAVVKADCIRFRPDPAHNSKYLNYALNCEQTRRWVKPIVHGVGRPRLNLKEIKSIPLPVAPRDDQDRIVEDLEQQLTRLDAGVSALKRIQVNLKRYRAAVLKAACEGRLVPTEAELARREGRSYEPASALLALSEPERARANPRRPRRNQPSGVSVAMQPDLPRLPEGWAWTTVSQLGTVSTGKTPPTSQSDYFDGDVPFFKPTDLEAGYNVRVARQTLTVGGAQLAGLLEPLAVLVTCIGATIGKAGLARVTCAVNQQINALSVAPSRALPEYVYCFFTSPLGKQAVKENAAATTLPILNKSRFERLRVPLPPFDEQRRIVAEVGRLLTVVENAENGLSAQTARASHLRRALLVAAFSCSSASVSRPLGARP